MQGQVDESDYIVAAVLRVATNTIAMLSRTSGIDKTFQGLMAEFLLAVARNLTTWCARAAEQGNGPTVSSPAWCSCVACLRTY